MQKNFKDPNQNYFALIPPNQAKNGNWDWRCSFCNVNNFQSRIKCFKCDRPKNSGYQEQQPQQQQARFNNNFNSLVKNPSDQIKPGDWRCLSCNVNNFQSRMKCFKCDNPRIQQQQIQQQQQQQQFNSQIQQSQQVQNDIQQMQIESESESESDSQESDGEWKCGGCGEFNRSQKCYECGKLKKVDRAEFNVYYKQMKEQQRQQILNMVQSDEENEDGYDQRKRQKHNNKKGGRNNQNFENWQCNSCQNDNPPKSKKCKKCKQRRDCDNSLVQSQNRVNRSNIQDSGILLQSQNSEQQYQQQDFWECNNCKNQNPHRSKKCKNCRERNYQQDKPRNRSKNRFQNNNISNNIQDSGILIKSQNSDLEQQQQLQQQYFWECNNCKHQNPHRSKKCKNCRERNFQDKQRNRSKNRFQNNSNIQDSGILQIQQSQNPDIEQQEQQQQQQQDFWECKHCEHQNPPKSKKCKQCKERQEPREKKEKKICQKHQQQQKTQKKQQQIEKAFGKCVIIPGNGCDGDVREANWYGKFEKKMNNLQYKHIFQEVILRDMPDPIDAKESIWAPFVKDLVGQEQEGNNVDGPSNTVLVGHSSGAVCALRLLEALPENAKPYAGCIIVSACYTDLGDVHEAMSGYYQRPWNWEKIKKSAEWIVQFHGTDDPFIPLSESRFIAGKLGLGANYHEIKNGSHFFEPFRQLNEVIKSKADQVLAQRQQRQQYAQQIQQEVQDQYQQSLQQQQEQQQQQDGNQVQQQQQQFIQKFQTQKLEEQKQQFQNQQDSLIEEVECCVCFEVIYNCVSVQPCLHNICQYCCLQWIEKNKNCPLCKVKIERIRKNTTLNNLINTILQNNPERNLSQEEKNKRDSSYQFPANQVEIKL